MVIAEGCLAIIIDCMVWSGGNTDLEKGGSLAQASLQALLALRITMDRLRLAQNGNTLLPLTARLRSSLKQLRRLRHYYVIR